METKQFTEAQKNLAEIMNKLTQEMVEAKAHVERLGKEIQQLQKFCEHDQYESHSERIAGSSYKECKICGRMF